MWISELLEPTLFWQTLGWPPPPPPALAPGPVDAPPPLVHAVKARDPVTASTPILASFMYDSSSSAVRRAADDLGRCRPALLSRRFRPPPTPRNLRARDDPDPQWRGSGAVSVVQTVGGAV